MGRLRVVSTKIEAFAKNMRLIDILVVPIPMLLVMFFFIIH